MRQNRFTIHRKFLVISVFGFLLSIQTYAGYLLKNIPGTPIIETSDATTICSGATATLTVNTASSPTCAGTYEWSNGGTGTSISVNATDAYTVRCLEGTEYSLPSNEIAVTVNPIPAAPVTSGGGDFCRSQNSTATLTATGCDGGIITWSNGSTGNSITVSVTNNYTATCEVNGCTSANSNGQQVNFFSTPLQPVILADGPTTVCQGESVTLRGETGSNFECFATLSWSTGETGNSITINTAGIYFATCSENGCSSENSNAIQVTVKAVPAPPTISGGGNFCRSENSSATLTATGCDGGIITWSNGSTGNSITVSVTNNYTATCEVNGCTSANSNGQQVNFFNTPQQPVIIADGPTTVCQGESVTLRGETGSNFECFATLRWSTGETGNSITVNTAGIYFATCEDNGCSSDISSAIQVTVNPIPAAPVTSGGGSFCRPENSTAVLTASGCDGGTITWSNGSTGSQTTVSVSNTYTATCEINGCTSPPSDGQQVNFFNTPLQPVIITDGPTTFCQGGSVTLRGETNSNSECFATLRWNTRETGNSITVNTAGIYFATCEDNGCSSENSSAIQVTVNPIPAPPTVSGGGDFCSPITTTNLTATGCDGGIITWSNGSTGNAITVSVTNNYTATCEVDGCTSANSNGQQVNFFSTPLQPVILADGPTNVCQGESVTLRGETGSNSECFATLRWNTGETGNSITVNTARIYFATCEDNGCSSENSSAIQVTVNPIPAPPTVSGGGDFCRPQNSTATLTATGCDGGVITWSNGSTGNAITVSNSRNYTATCTVNGCTSNNSNTVNVNFFTTPAAPIIEATGATSFCTTESVTIQLAAASPTCNGTITWSNGQSGVNSITVNTSETYTATCSENGCVSPASNPIQITASPTPNPPTVSGGGDFCSPITSTTLTANGCAGTVRWSDNQTGNSIAVNTSGNYNATCEVNGCVSGISGSVTVNFYTTPNTPNITADGATSFCNGSSVNLTANGCNGNVNWSNGATGNTINVAASGEYFATCESNGCVSGNSNAIQVTASPTPNPPTVSGGGDFCSPITSTTLIATGCAGTIRWSDNQTGNSIAVNTSGNYNATCEVNGCTSPISGSVAVNFYTTPSAPIIEATGTTSFCTGSSVTIQIAATSPTCNGTIIWSNGQSGTNSISVNTTANYTATCSENGCGSPVSNSIGVQLLPNINVELTKRDIDCFGANNGNISINPSGGTGNNYQISWPGSTSTDFQLFGLTPGTYEFRVTNNNGCEFNGSTTISQPTPPNALFTQSPISCFDANDGRIVLNASGGTLPYRYQINSGGFIPFGSPNQTTIESVGPGTYSVSIIDANNCTIGSFENISFINPNPITISIISKANPLGATTADGTITAQVQGGTIPFLAVSWSSTGETINSDPNLLPITSTLQGVGGGTFTLTAMDARNCITTLTEELIAPLPLSFTLENQPAKCFGERSGQVIGNASGGIAFPGNTYEYTLFSASDEIMAIQTDPIFGRLQQGSYTLRVRDANGISTSSAFEITQPDRLRLNEITTINNYCTTSAKGLIKVEATGGTPTYSFAWSNGENNAEIKNLTAGNYTLTLTDQNACQFDTLLIVETNATKLNATLLESRTTCPESCDGSFFAVVNGGFEPYAINWSEFSEATNQSTISGVCPGTETNFTVSDSLGCSVTTRNVAVSAPFPESISLNGTIRVCPTDFQLDGQQFWGVDYEWTLPDGNKVNTAVLEGKGLGDYVISVTNSRGCLSQKTISVASNFEGEAFIASPAIAPVTDPVVFIDLTNPKPADFFWQVPTGTTIIEENRDRIIIEFPEVGFYTITALANIDGCDYPVEKSIEIVSQETYDDGGFPAPLSRLRADFRVFPNPIDDFNIHAEVSFSTPKQFEITLLNPVNSKVIFEKSYSETKAKNINIPVSSDMPSGAYLLLMKSGNEYLARKIVIR